MNRLDELAAAPICEPIYGCDDGLRVCLNLTSELLAWSHEIHYALAGAGVDVDLKFLDVCSGGKGSTYSGDYDSTDSVIELVNGERVTDCVNESVV